MGETVRENLTVAQERVLLVGVTLPESGLDPWGRLTELAALTRTAGAQIADQIIVKRRAINPRYYIGTGKAREIAEKVHTDEIDTIIFDNDLSPAQIRELEEIASRKVLDRSELILDIFAAHARTAEARLQVELAQLEYTYPRLRHMWTHLERVAGGAATASAAIGGIGTRGPGEKQIEIDRRLVQKRVSYLKRRIADVDRRKVRQIRNRRRAFCVCLVGYTNTGKSTLLNLLTGADTYVADQLFATLGTKTRRWDLGNGQDVLLSDTVGFIRDLPHHLVASFKATLEEAADGSDHHVDEQIAAVEKVLEELGCTDSAPLLVLNKVDRIEDPTIRTVLGSKHSEALLVSATTGEGACELAEEVCRRSTGLPVRVAIEDDCRKGRLMQYISQHAQIESRSYRDSTAHIDAVMPADRIEQLSRFGQDVRIVRRRGEQPWTTDEP
jgi:GTP-binding protein HflX